jgi:hypothetical protein
MLSKSRRGHRRHRLIPAQYAALLRPTPVAREFGSRRVRRGAPIRQAKNQQVNCVQVGQVNIQVGSSVP